MFVFCILAMALTSDATANGGRIRGVVVDATGAALPGAIIRVVQPDSNVVVARARANQAGDFETDAVGEGEYVVAVWLQGFRARWTSPVVLRDGSIVSLGNVRLDLAGCDAPGVLCDSFGLGPPEPDNTRGFVDVKLGCGVDLNAGKVYCESRQPGGVDLNFLKDDSGIYLIPANGAALSPPNLPRGDCRDANPSTAKLPVDGLGPGDDICARTHGGRLSHMFVMSDVERGSDHLRLWHVTRKD
jgi:hypothetical protein